MLGLHEGWVEGSHLGREEGMHEEEKLLQLGTDDFFSDCGLGEGVEEVQLEGGIAVVRGALQLGELVRELGGDASETFQDETLLPV